MSAEDIRKMWKLMESIAEQPAQIQQPVNEAYDDSNPYPFGGGPRPPSLEQAHNEGYERGATWPVEWNHVPGGPWTTSKGHKLMHNPQWDEYAEHTQAVKKAWLDGWWKGLFEKNSQHPIAIQYSGERYKYIDDAPRALNLDEQEVDEATPLPRFIPQGSTEVKDDQSSAVVYTYEKNGKPVAIGYAGKGGKAKWHYNFRDEAQRQKYIDQFFASTRSSEQYRKENDRRKVAGVARGIEVGDILYTSWGYSMTIVDFYEVTQLVGNNSAIVRKIEQREADGKESNGWTGHALGVKGQFVGPDIKVTHIKNGQCKIEGHYAYKWDGRPIYWNRMD